MARDTTKYIFNGEKYNKSRLVLAILKAYVEDVKSNWDDLTEIFPKSLQGSLGVVISVSDFNERHSQSPDIENRFFTDEILKTIDNVEFYVCTQWGLGNIVKLIDASRAVGYVIQNENLKTLFENYISNPHREWVDSYQKVCQEFKQRASSGQLDVAYMETIWQQPNNGVSDVSPGFLSREEYENIKSLLPEITYEIASDPSPEKHKKYTQWIQEQKENNNLKTAKRGVLNRVFATADPTKYSTLTGRKFIKQLAGKLKDSFGLEIQLTGNWAEDNIALVIAIKNEIYDGQDTYLFNTFIWRLWEILVNEAKNEEVEEQSPAVIKPVIKPIKEVKPALNKILYGPPGTGKTYNTVNAALQIIDPEFYAENRTDRLGIKQRFDQLIQEKRIGFVTFHQSFSYEDFVEGIRAESVDGQLTYRVVDGVFKELCDRAKVGEKYSIDDAINRLREDLEDKELTLKTSTGKEFSVSYRGGITFRIKPASSETTFDYPASIENIKNMYRGVSTSSIYNPSYVKSILKYLQESYDLDNATENADSAPVVLIIDEINRGNTANIFGELITLIEPSKRAGAEEALEVTLPYSKEKFSVPNNLYIIGTMNTADRSLALLDTALRRRFQFEEMAPNPELLSGVMVDGINIKKLLETINKRIALLYDREHRIGHSFFMPLQNNPSFDRLRDIFSNNILPLLEEYFFEDWLKISQVLGDFSKPDQLKMIIPSISESEMLELLGDEGVDMHNIQYQRNQHALSNPKAYQLIYEPSA